LNIQFVNVYPIEKPYLDNLQAYKSPILLLDSNLGYYYCGRGVSIPIKERAFYQLKLYPKIFEYSLALKYHSMGELELVRRWTLPSGPHHAHHLQKLIARFPNE
jgi:hypothetical protein